MPAMLAPGQGPIMSSVFSSPPGGPGELAFRLGAIPIRIQPWFWLTAFVLANPWFEEEPRPWPVLLFILSCLISIIWHELGHAWAMGWFGARHVEIALTGFGGYASTHARARFAWQRIVIALAGPANQLALLAMVLALVKAGFMEAGMAETPLLDVFVSQMAKINLLWPLLNLIPIFPLDGGCVVRELGTSLLGNRGLKSSLYLSITICACMFLWIVSAGGSLFNAMLFGLLLAQNIQELNALNDNHRFDDPGSWRS